MRSLKHEEGSVEPCIPWLALAIAIVADLVVAARGECQLEKKYSTSTSGLFFPFRVAE